MCELPVQNLTYLSALLLLISYKDFLIRKKREKKEKGKEKAKKRSMELMIIMVAVLCFLDDFMVICFCCEQQVSQDFMVLPQSILSSETGLGRSGSIWWCFSSSSKQKEARSLHLHCSDTGHLNVLCCLISDRVDWKRAADRNHPAVQQQQVMQGVCQCC